ncbi:hypothetical protein RhiirC2_803998 [Rhizophagus irregularis]|uniref:Uncharacterized protein n=1 Tax=Rhizophagus irregularis TaxID=588596 RepID=A0A2N1L6G7_9GLOM|nr:hypothetical protein RhiirC2_803998 [Rhizophagus irregularis]
MQGFFRPDFKLSAKQRINSHLPTEQNNIVTIKKQPQKSINNFVDKITSAEQNEAELLFAQAVYHQEVTEKMFITSSSMRFLS